MKFKDEKFPKLASVFNELTDGQEPEALFITCSDSRVLPSLLTQSKPGELFIIRNAGNIACLDNKDASFAASLEYAVKVLKVEHIVVCGHSHCGAVTTLLDSKDLEGLPAIASLVENMQPVLDRVDALGCLPEDRLDRAIEENVRFQLEKLSDIPYVRDELIAGKLELHGWVYRFEHGDVVAIDDLDGDFFPLPTTQKSRRLTKVSPVEPDYILLDVDSTNFEEICELALTKLHDSYAIDSTQKDKLKDMLLKREQVASTAIGRGIACPHIYLDGIRQPVTVFLRLKNAIDLKALDGIDTDLVFLLIGCPRRESEHINTLVNLAKLVQDEDARTGLHAAKNPQEIVEHIQQGITDRTTNSADKKMLGLAGIESRTGRFTGGLIDDIKRRWPYYIKDYLEGLNLKTLAATIFMFFACITATITFGSVMAVETAGQIGVVEMILATALCGMIYALVSGQPLIILGCTGPLLAF
ncbi:MAG: carbonic anhydrase, partial [Planctomycetota bacterium]|nr:carbonic anhydrase [Planctomycetota bacterium]